MDSVTNAYPYKGFHKVTLARPITVKQGQSYAIVVTQKNPDGGYVLSAQTVYGGMGDSKNAEAVVNAGESFLFMDGIWDDFSEPEAQKLVLLEVSDLVSEMVVDNFAIKGYCVKADDTPDIKTHIVTYQLNGGTYEESSEDIIEEYPEGTTIKIHAAPEKAGFRFQYWKGSEYLPGDIYVVTEDHTFTAQWEKLSEPVNPDEADQSGVVKTGDDSHTIFWLLLFLSAIALTVMGVLRRKQ